MGFKPISIEKYIEKYMKIDQNVDKNEIETKLNMALTNYHLGEKCPCGNDIWVIASAFIGNCCYTCLTGKSESDNDYEIDSAIVKNQNDEYISQLDVFPFFENFCIYDDDGNEINRDLIKKPSLCLVCIYNDNQFEEFLCDLTRFDQRDSEEFCCYSFKRKGP